jgi:protease-4
MQSILRLTAYLLLPFVAGCAPSFLVTPVANTNAIQEVEVQSARGWFAPKIAMIEVEGMLMNARTGGFLQAQENKLSLFAQQLDAARNDRDVKAVVLRVNSPGGTVSCSDAMYEMLQKFRKETGKPVIASAQEVMASGAYYVSCASEEIVAQPTSVVGSIGVMLELFEVDQGLAKIGIYPRTIKSGALKEMGSPFKPITAEEKAVMQGMIDEYYARFVAVVQSKCHIADQMKLTQSTDGRVFSGEQALAMGLIDRVGMLEDAIELAKKRANAPTAKVIMYKRPYGYSGSIYADASTPPPQANVLQLPLPESLTRPVGFYYVWEP